MDSSPPANLHAVLFSHFDENEPTTKDSTVRRTCSILYVNFDIFSNQRIVAKTSYSHGVQYKHICGTRTYVRTYQPVAHSVYLNVKRPAQIGTFYLEERRKGKNGRNKCVFTVWFLKGWLLDVRSRKNTLLGV